VLDFLFLVGELEDAGYQGDSAETALVACEDNTDKVKCTLETTGLDFIILLLFEGKGILAETWDVQRVWISRESYP